MLPNAWGEAGNSSDGGNPCFDYLEKAGRAVENFLESGVIEFATEIPDTCSDYGLASVKYMIDYAKGSETCEKPEAIDTSIDGTLLLERFKGIAFVAKYKSDVVKKAMDVCAAYQFKGVLDVYLAGNTETALEQFAALKVPDQTTKPEAYYYYMLAKVVAEDKFEEILPTITKLDSDTKYYERLNAVLSGIIDAHRFKGVLDKYLAGDLLGAVDAFNVQTEVPDQTTQPEAYYYYMLAKVVAEDKFEEILPTITKLDSDTKYYERLNAVLSGIIDAQIINTKTALLSGESVRAAAAKNPKIYNSGFVFMAQERGLDKERTLQSLGQACLDYAAADNTVSAGDCIKFMSDVMDAQ